MTARYTFVPQENIKHKHVAIGNRVENVSPAFADFTVAVVEAAPDDTRPIEEWMGNKPAARRDLNDGRLLVAFRASQEDVEAAALALGVVQDPSLMQDRVLDTQNIEQA